MTRQDAKSSAPPAPRHDSGDGLEPTLPIRIELTNTEPAPKGRETRAGSVRERPGAPADADLPFDSRTEIGPAPTRPSKQPQRPVLESSEPADDDDPATMPGIHKLSDLAPRARGEATEIRAAPALPDEPPRDGRTEIRPAPVAREPRAPPAADRVGPGRRPTRDSQPVSELELTAPVSLEGLGPPPSSEPERTDPFPAQAPAELPRRSTQSVQRASAPAVPLPGAAGERVEAPRRATRSVERAEAPPPMAVAAEKPSGERRATRAAPRVEPPPTASPTPSTSEAPRRPTRAQAPAAPFQPEPPQAVPARRPTRAQSPVAVSPPAPTSAPPVVSRRPTRGEVAAEAAAPPRPRTSTRVPSAAAAPLGAILEGPDEPTGPVPKGAGAQPGAYSRANTGEGVRPTTFVGRVVDFTRVRMRPADPALRLRLTIAGVVLSVLLVGFIVYATANAPGERPSTSELQLLYPYGFQGANGPRGEHAPGAAAVTYEYKQHVSCTRFGEPDCLLYEYSNDAFSGTMVLKKVGSDWQRVSDEGMPFRPK